MTDRINSLVVVFEDPIRVDDAEAYVEAIKLMRGVIKVYPGPVNDIQDYAVREQVKYDIFQKLMEGVFNKDE